MKKKVFAIFICLLLICTIACASEKTENTQINEKKEDIQSIEKNKKNEEYPFFPSLLNTENGQPTTPDQFEEPIVCSGCHPEIYQQWKGSMHSNAFVDPIFTALWKIGAKETNGLTDKLCGGCHTAVGVLSNDLVFKDNEFQTSDIAKEGVHCDLCHTVTRSSFKDTPTNEPENASLILAPGNIKRGPYKDAESPHHETAYSELHTKSEFCANCHQVYHPINNFHIERTYDEWKFSVYAQKGIQCQDCHMMPIEKAIETARTLTIPKNPGKPCVMGPERDNMFTHEFVGANFTVPTLLNAKKHAGIAVERLKSAAELDVEAEQVFKSGEMATIAVKVTNVGAGHNLPTSLTEVRQMWLDIKVTDQNGNIVFTSGDLDDKGNIKEGSIIFNAYAVDKDGHHTVKPWEITRFEYDKTIPPKGSATEKFVMMIPSNLTGILDIKAVLRYRSFPQSLANFLLGEDAPTLPVVDMTQKSIKVEIEKH